MANKTNSRLAAAAAWTTVRKEQNIKDKYAKQQLEQRVAKNAEQKRKKEEEEKKKREEAAAAKAAGEELALAEAERVVAVERAKKNREGKRWSRCRYQSTSDRHEHSGRRFRNR